MIKFFRKIRQKMIKDNKVSKYLLYAIGEVVLVVIGILIALSLNNNNENKKLVVQEIKILKEIKNELFVALNDVKEDFNDHKRNLNSAKILYNSILHKESYNDSLMVHYFLLFDEDRFLASQSAFESLKSLGLEIISNDSIRDDIVTVYLYINDAMNDTRVLNTINELKTLLKPHILIDRDRLLSDTENTWLNLREIPFKFNNYKSFLDDENFLYSLMSSIKERQIQVYLYGRYEKGLEHYISNIEKEIKSLENK